jgi:hypothetical protein
LIAAVQEEERETAARNDWTPRYKSGEINLSDPDRMSDKWRLEFIREYIATTTYQIEQTVRLAIDARKAGRRALSLREADIATRSLLDLTVDGVIDFSLMNDCFLVEGTVGAEDSPWELRRKYNTGLAWVRSRPAALRDDIAEIDRLSRLKVKMDDILAKLISAGLRAWRVEVDVGFNDDLLRPEWMTDAQYDIASQRKMAVQ